MFSQYNPLGKRDIMPASSPIITGVAACTQFNITTVCRRPAFKSGRSLSMVPTLMSSSPTSVPRSSTSLPNRSMSRVFCST